MGMSKQLKRVVVTVTSVIMVASSVPVDALAQARDTSEPMTSAAGAVVQGMTSQLLPQDTAAPTTQQDDKSVAPVDTPATADSTSGAPSADSADATATDAATPVADAPAPQADATPVETPAPAQAPAPQEAVAAPDAVTLDANTTDAVTGLPAPTPLARTADGQLATTTVYLPDDVARAGHTLLGWALDASASTPDFPAGSNVAASRAMTLHAVWKQDEPSQGGILSALGISLSPQAESSYVISTTLEGVTTLTFRYGTVPGVSTNSAHVFSDPAHTYGTLVPNASYNIQTYPTWSQEPVYNPGDDTSCGTVMSTTQNVVFHSSFAQARPYSTCGWFWGFSALRTVQDPQNLDLSECVDMSGMFKGCSAMTDLDVHMWDVSRCERLEYVFSACSALETIDVAGWNTSSATTLWSLFEGTSLRDIDLSTFDVSKVTNLRGLVFECHELETLDLSTWHLPSLDNIQDLATNDAKLRTIYVPQGTDWTAVPNHNSGTFRGCTSLVGTCGTKTFAWSSSSTDRTYARACAQNADGYLSVKDSAAGAHAYLKDGTLTFAKGTSVVEGATFYTDFLDVSYTFTSHTPWYADRDSITAVTFDESFSQAEPANIMYWFHGLTSLTSISNLGNLNLSACTSTQSAFEGCSALVAGPEFADFVTTSRNTDCNYMFYGCSSLTDLDLSGMDMSHVTNIDYMLCMGTSATPASNLGPTSITTARTVDGVTRDWNISSLTTALRAFANCTRLTSFDTSGWTDAATTTTFSACFYYSTGIKTMDMTGWRAASSCVTWRTFEGLTSCTTIDISTWDPVASSATSDYTFGEDRALTAILTKRNFTLTTSNPSANKAGMFNECTSLKCQAGTAYDGAFDPAVTDDTYARVALPSDASTTGALARVNGYFTPAEPLAYAVLDGTTNVMTFKYGKIVDDPLYAAPNSRIWWGFESTNLADAAGQPWSGHRTAVEVVIDESFHEVTPTTMSYWFRQFEEMTTFTNPQNVNTSNLQYLTRTFYRCRKLSSLDLTSWDMTKVKNMDSFMLRVGEAATVPGTYDVRWKDPATGEFATRELTACTSGMWIFQYVGNANNRLVADDFHFPVCTAIGDNGTAKDAVFSDMNAASISAKNWTYDVLPNAQYMFARTNTGDADFSGWSMPAATNLSYMFDTVTCTGKVDLHGLNAPACTNATYMITHCSGTEIDMTGWSFGQAVTTTNHLYAWNTFPVFACDTIDFPLATDCCAMVGGCRQCPASLAAWISALRLPSARDCHYIFNDNRYTEPVDISFNNCTYSTATDARYFIMNCTNVNSIDISNLALPASINYQQFFAGTDVKTIYAAPTQDWTSLTGTTTNMFNGCSRLAGRRGDVTYALNSTVDKSYARPFTPTQNGYFTVKGGACAAVDGTTFRLFVGDADQYDATWPGVDATAFTAQIETWKPVTDQASMNPWWGSYASSITAVEVDPSFAAVKPTNMTSWFYGFQNCGSWTGLDLINTSQCTSIASMFYDAKLPETLDLSSWDTSKVTAAQATFRFARTLKELKTVPDGGTTGWDLRNVTTLTRFFSRSSSVTYDAVRDFRVSNKLTSVIGLYEAVSVTDVDLRNLSSISAAANFEYMVCGNSKLKTINIAGIPNPTNTCKGAFSNNPELTTIYASSNARWTPNATLMFEGSPKIVGVCGNYRSTYDTSNTSGGTYGFCCCYYVNAYFTPFQSAIAVATDSNTKLTHYCANGDDPRFASSVAYSRYDNVADTIQFNVVAPTVTNVTFDSSFAAIKPKSMKIWFQNFRALTSITGMNEYLDASQVTTVNRMCQGAKISDSSVRSAFENLNITNVCTDMEATFHGLSGVPETLNLRKWDAQNVTKAVNMILQGSETNFSYTLKAVRLPRNIGEKGSACATQGLLAYNAGLQICFGDLDCDMTSCTSNGLAFSQCKALKSFWGSKGYSFAEGGLNKAYDRAFSIDKTGATTNGYITPCISTPGDFMYGWCTDSGTKLTFYYGDIMSRYAQIYGGSGYFPKTDTASDRTPRWIIASVSWRNTIKTASFDASCKNCVFTGNWDVMDWFQDHQALTTVTGLENLRIKNQYSMDGFFKSCSSLTSFTAPASWKEGSVYHFASMFNGCSSLKTSDISNLGNRRGIVHYCQNMFANCTSLTTVDFSGIYDTSEMSAAFANCSKLTRIYTDRPNTDLGSNATNTFVGCSVLKAQYGTQTYNWNSSKVAGAYCRTYNGSNEGYFTLKRDEPYAILSGTTLTLKYGVLVGVDTTNVVSLVNESGAWRTKPFESGTAATTIKNTATKVVIDPSFAVCQPTTMQGMFRSLAKVTTIENLATIDTSKCTDFSYLFSGMSALRSVALPTTWDTSKVKTFHQMFYNCAALTGTMRFPDEWSFASSTDTGTNQWFYGCKALTGVDLSSYPCFDKIGTMREMFYGCTALTSVSFGEDADLSNLYSLNKAFYGCQSIQEIPLPASIADARIGGDVGSTRDTQGLFCNCLALTHVENLDKLKILPTNRNTSLMFHDVKNLDFTDFTSWDLSGVTEAYGMFRGYGSNIANATFDLRYKDPETGEFATRDWAALTAVGGMFDGMGNASSTILMDDFSFPALTVQCRDTSTWTTVKVVADSGENYWNAQSSDGKALGGMLANIKGANVQANRWSLPELTEACCLFIGSSGDFTVKDWSLPKCTRGEYALGGFSSDSTIDASGWSMGASGVSLKAFARTPQAGTYAGRSAREISIARTRFNNATNMNAFFYDAADLTSIDVSGIMGISSITSLDYAFGKCSNLQTIWCLPTDDWNTAVSSSATSGNIFQECSSLVGSSGGMTHDWTSGDTGARAMARPKLANQEGLFSPKGDCYFAALDPVTQHLAFEYGDIAMAGSTEAPRYVMTNFMGFAHGMTSDKYPWAAAATGAEHIRDLVKTASFEDSFHVRQAADDVRLHSLGNFFCSWPNLESIQGIEGLDTSQVTDFEYVFGSDPKLTDAGLAGLGNWDTSKGTSFLRIFKGDTSLTGTMLDLSGWDMTSAQNFQDFFNGCTSLKGTGLHMGSWDVSHVTTMDNFFNGCTALAGTGLGISSWRPSAVTNLSYFFNGCTSLTSGELDLSGWDVSHVTTLAFFMNHCDSLECARAIEGWTDLSALTTTENLLGNCASLTSADLSGWRTSSALTTLTNMFINCSQLCWLDVSGINTTAVTSATGIFHANPRLGRIFATPAFQLAVGTSVCGSDHSLVGVSGTKTFKYTDNPTTNFTYARVYDGTTGGFLTNATEAPNTAYAVYDDTSHTLTFKNGDPHDEPRDARLMFDFDHRAYALDGTLAAGTIRPWDERGISATMTKVVFDPSLKDAEALTSCELWFANLANLTEVSGMANLPGDHVTSYAHMFEGCTALTTIPLAGWSTSAAATYEYTFAGCSSLATLDTAAIDVSHATSLAHVFDGCASLNQTSIDGVSGWLPLRAQSFEAAFRGCSSMTSIDMSHWSTPSCTTLTSMFEGCTALGALDLNSMTIARVTSVAAIAKGCTSLTEVDLSSWPQYPSFDATGAFEGCSSLTSIFAVEGGDWSVNAPDPTAAIFTGCTSLRGVYAAEVCEYQEAHVTATRARTFAGVADLPGYFSLVPNAVVYAMYEPEAAKLTFKNAPLPADGSVALEHIYTGLTVASFSAEVSVTQTESAGAVTVTSTNVPWEAVRTSVRTVEFDCSFQSVAPLSTAAWFAGMTSLTTVVGGQYLDTSSDLNMRDMFAGDAALATFDAGNWDTSAVQSARNMFAGCQALTADFLNDSVAHWDTSWLADASYLFFGCTGIQGDISLAAGREGFGWGGTRLQTASHMFTHCSGLTGADLSGWDQTALTTTQSLFEGCFRLTRADVHDWDVTRVTSMQTMFKDCRSLEVLDLTGWCDAGGSATAASVARDAMFQNCSILARVYVGSADASWTASSASSANMFAGCDRLYGMAGATYNSAFRTADKSAAHASATRTASDGHFLTDARTDEDVAYATLDHAVTPASAYDADDATFGDGTLTLRFGRMDTSKVCFVGWESATYATTTPTGAGATFRDVVPWTMEYGVSDTFVTDGRRHNINHVVMDASLSGNVKPVSMALWFADCRNLKDVTGAQNLDTSEVVSMREMFVNTAALGEDSAVLPAADQPLTALNLSGWNVSKLNSAQSMLEGNYLTSLDVSGWTLPSAAATSLTLERMLATSHQLTTLDLSSWSFARVTSTEEMFKDTAKLTTLRTATTVDLGALASMASMLDGCAELTTLTSGGWATSAALVDASRAFKGCSSLAELDLSALITTNATSQADMLAGMSELMRLQVGPGYVNAKSGSLATVPVVLFRSDAGHAASEDAAMAQTTLTDDDRVEIGGALPSYGASSDGYNLYRRAYKLCYDANKPMTASSAIAGTTADGYHAYDAGVTLTANGFELVGWTYTGWSGKADGTGDAYDDRGTYQSLVAKPSADGTSSVTIYAVWEANAYQVEYLPNRPVTASNQVTGTTATSDHTYDVEAPLTSCGFALTGWTFTGWNTASDGSGTPYANAQVVENLTPADGDRVTLYAQWVQRGYHVRYEKNKPGTATPTVEGTMADSDHTFDVAGTLRPLAYSLRGWTFDGWDTQADGRGTRYGNAAATPNLVAAPAADGTSVRTLFAQWRPNLYTITYLPNKGAGTTAVTGSTAQSTHTFDLTAPLTGNGYSRVGYTYLGWSPSATAIAPTYTDKQGVVNLVDDPVSDGTSNLDLYAIWQANDYTVTLDGQGTATEPASPATATVTATYDADMPAATAPTREGYTFGGFYTQAGGAGTQYYTASAGSSRTWDMTLATTLYAKWTYGVTYLPNKEPGSTDVAGVPAPTSHTYAVSSALASARPTRVGYDFTNWNTTAAGTGTTYTPSQQVTDVAPGKQLFAQWSPKTYTATLDGQDATSHPQPSVTATYDANVPDVTTPTKTDYAFVGYRTQAAGAGDVYVDADGHGTRPWRFDAATTLYAQWDYDISYEGNKGGGSSDIQGTTASTHHTYKAASDLAGNGFSRIGYTFRDWNTSADGHGTKYDAGQSVTDVPEGKTLHAQWVPHTFTVNFDKNKPGTAQPDNAVTGSTDSVTHTFDAPAALPSCGFKLIGYTFLGWSKDPGAKSATYTDQEVVTNLVADPAANGSSSVTLYAVWRANTYQVTALANGGSLGGAEIVQATCDDTVAIAAGGANPSPATDASWTFAGWQVTKVRESDEGVVGLVTQDPETGAWLYRGGSADVNLTARWLVSQPVPVEGLTYLHDENDADVQQVIVPAGVGYLLAAPVPEDAADADQASVHTDGSAYVVHAGSYTVEARLDDADFDDMRCVRWLGSVAAWDSASASNVTVEALVDKATNSWDVQPNIDNIDYGGILHPGAKADYQAASGEPVFEFARGEQVSDSPVTYQRVEDYSPQRPTDHGVYYMRAVVAEADDWYGITSDGTIFEVVFDINKRTIPNTSTLKATVWTADVTYDGHAFEPDAYSTDALTVTFPPEVLDGYVMNPAEDEYKVYYFTETDYGQITDADFDKLAWDPDAAEGEPGHESSMVDAGTYYVYVGGINNFQGYVWGTFTILPSPEMGMAAPTSYDETFDGARHTVTPQPVTGVLDRDTDNTQVWWTTTPDDESSWSLELPDYYDTTYQEDNQTDVPHVLYTRATNPNYVTTPTVSGSVSIRRKLVEVFAHDNQKQYGVPDPELESHPEGLVGEDQVEWDISRAAGEELGDYVITPAGDAVQGNYWVEYVTATFTIVRRDITGSRIEGLAASYTYAGKALTPIVDVRLPDGVLLAEVRDFVVDYIGNNRPGVAVVEVTGVNNYVGKIDSSFVVLEERARPLTVWRLYNPNSGEHFYTKADGERRALVEAGWTDEGVGWYAPDRHGDEVYRVYNPYSGDHHYTASSYERDYLVNVGWRNEGVAWLSDSQRRVPLYRDYNPNARVGSHNYTTSAHEHQVLGQMGWQAEGIGWYGMPKQ